MDAKHRDRLTRTLTETGTRRGLVGLLLGAVALGYDASSPLANNRQDRLFGGGAERAAAEKATTSNASGSTRSAPTMVIGCDTTAECVGEFNNQDLECFSDAAACPAKLGNQCSRPKQCDTNRSSAHAARGRRLLASLGYRFNRATRKAAPPR